MTVGLKPLRSSALCSGTNHRNRSREKAPSRRRSSRGESTARHARSWHFYRHRLSFYTFGLVFHSFLPR